MMDFTQEKTYQQTREHVSQAHTLIPEAYLSQKFYEIEQDRVFSQSWVCVGYTSQLKEPGSAFLTSVAGQPLFVTRDRKNEIRCFYNVCRHRGSQLLDKDGTYSSIRCPYHSWLYSSCGELLATPYFSADSSFSKKDYRLIGARVETWGCFIFVNLNPNACSLQEWLGDLPERLNRYPLHDFQLVKRQNYTVQSNWKLIAENFMEYYHVPTIHPDLARVSKVNSHFRDQGPGMYMGFRTSPLSSASNSPFESIPPLPSLNLVESKSAYWIHIFPNISLFLLPNHLFTLILKPESPTTTLEHTDLLAHPDIISDQGHSASLEDIFQYWDRVNRQDFEAVQKVQIGMTARPYPGGRMSERFEEPIHRFQNMLIDKMTGIHRIPHGDTAFPVYDEIQKAASF